jgi:hypothetical protein
MSPGPFLIYGNRGSFDLLYTASPATRSCGWRRAAGEAEEAKRQERSLGFAPFLRQGRRDDRRYSEAAKGNVNSAGWKPALRKARP